jgi:hypothetical protein
LRDDPSVSVPDSQAVLLRFRSGASATISTSCATGSASFGGLDFVIAAARVTIQGEELRVDPPDSYELPPVPAECPGIDECFIRAISTGDRTLLKSPYDDAMKTLAVTLAANRSAEDAGRRIDLEDFSRREMGLAH